MRASIATLLFCALMPTPVVAQERSAVLEAPLEADLGDPIDVILTVTGEPDDSVAVPKQTLAPFEVLDKKAQAEAAAEGRSTTFTFELRLLCFETGVHALGPLQVRITTADGELMVLESEARTIEVHSVLANEPDPQWKPATDPVIVEQEDRRPLIALAALVLLGIGAIVAWLLMRWWHGRERPEPAPPPPPPPWETALAELREHEQRRETAIAQGRIEPWVDAVSDSIRGYLGLRFGFHGLESTTDEIAEKLRESKSLPIAPQEATTFLERCDLVKFARASLAEDASRALIEEAFALVTRTRPGAPSDQGDGS